MISLLDGYSIPANEITFQYARSSGPGGQNVNKVNSKAILFWNFSENNTIPDGVRKRFQKKYEAKINSEGFLVIHSEEFRDRPKNIKNCEEKLRNMLLSVWLAPKRRKPTKPTKASQEKRIQEKKGRAETKKNRQKIRGC